MLDCGRFVRRQTTAASAISTNGRILNQTDEFMKSILLTIGLALATASAVRAADVKENWDKNCLKCHGADGKGNTKMGKQSGVKD